MNTILDATLYIFSALGGIVAIRHIYHWIQPYRSISWKKVEKGIIQLKEKLIKTNYNPTLIVGIGRGGSVVGALLSGALGNIPILVIDRVYEWSNNQRKEGFCDEINVSKNLDKVLLVAGELHSGNTAKKYSDYFNKLGAKEIKVLTFMKESYPTFKPDYYYIETDASNIRFPWMITKEYKRDSLK